MSSVLRISFVLPREDNPRLYDHLIQFPKGPRRVGRLRTMAYDGLLAESTVAALPSSQDVEVGPSGQPAVCRDRTQASLELFSDPVGE